MAPKRYPKIHAQSKVLQTEAPQALDTAQLLYPHSREQRISSPSSPPCPLSLLLVVQVLLRLPVVVLALTGVPYARIAYLVEHVLELVLCQS